MTQEEKRVLVVCADLMFSAGIREAGISLGVPLEFIDSQEAWEKALGRFRAPLLLADLHHHALGGERAGALVAALRASGKNARAYAVAWGRHTEPGLLQSAVRAGFDRAMPRSLFVREMPELVRRAAADEI